MNKELGFIAFEFARRKLCFYKNENWKDIRLFGLFRWGEVSKYLVGNPAKIKSFKKGLIKTTYNKSNEILWCQPTEEFWNDYILPILNMLKNKQHEDKIAFIERRIFYEDYKI